MSFPGHVHARDADRWLTSLGDSFATCPITQGTVLRQALREGFDIATAIEGLARITARSDHVFWPDSIMYEEVRVDGVIGHSQVTDAYLAQLARSHGGRLATFDGGLAALHGDVAELIPTTSNGL
jgi:predicted nucleic acid-binding protein